MQRVRTVERIANRSIVVETTYVPVWDGTEACGGRLLGDYVPPPPPRPKTWLVIEPAAPVVRPARVPRPRPVRVPRPARVRRQQPPPVPRRGPAFAARSAVWALLAQPITVNEIAVLVQLPRRALAGPSPCFCGAARFEAVAEKRRVLGDRKTTAYQRAAAFRDVETWPVLPRGPR